MREVVLRVVVDVVDVVDVVVSVSGQPPIKTGKPGMHGIKVGPPSSDPVVVVVRSLVVVVLVVVLWLVVVVVGGVGSGVWVREVVVSGHPPRKTGRPGMHNSVVVVVVTGLVVVVLMSPSCDETSLAVSISSRLKNTRNKCRATHRVRVEVVVVRVVSLSPVVVVVVRVVVD